MTKPQQNSEGRQEKNAWLSDEAYLNSRRGLDRNYLLSIAHEVKRCVSGFPVPLVTTYDNSNKTIRCNVGAHTYDIYLQDDPSPKEIHQKLTAAFQVTFPHYCANTGEMVDVMLSAEEIAELVRTGKIHADEIFNQRRSAPCVETGRIMFVWMNDKFLLARGRTGDDDKQEIRIAHRPVIMFLKDVRKIKSDVERRDFILSNSTFIKDAEDR